MVALREYVNKIFIIGTENEFAEMVWMRKLAMEG
jgi:hypothetical protein